MSKIKIGIVQVSATGDKELNIKKTREMVKEAAEKGADIVVLPEMWCCPYRTDYFLKFSEDKNGPIYNSMVEMARENKILLIGGSVPVKIEGNDEKVYNQNFVFDEKGREIYNYAKINMFDIDLPNGKSFRESSKIKSGKTLGVFETKFGTMGVAICYDIRFPELFRYMYEYGAKLIFIPGTFTIDTGKMHWELLLRSRAVDYQIFTVGASIARDDKLSKNAFGHSLVANPSGEVIEKFDIFEKVDVVEIDLEEVDRVRNSIPLRKSRMNRIK